MRPIILILTALLLAGCIGNPPRQPGPVRNDLGDPPVAGTVPALPLAGIEVRAVAWLDSAAQTYRLAYADDQERRAYANSRWVAVPAGLVERFLQRQLVPAASGKQAAGCRIELVLDEFEQRFATPQSSEFVLAAGATLRRPGGNEVLARTAFTLRRPAPTPDAAGGARGARAATQALGAALEGWLRALASERPTLPDACRG